MGQAHIAWPLCPWPGLGTGQAASPIGLPASGATEYLCCAGVCVLGGVGSLPPTCLTHLSGACRHDRFTFSTCSLGFISPGVLCSQWIFTAALTGGASQTVLEASRSHARAIAFLPGQLVTQIPEG